MALCGLGSSGRKFVKSFIHPAVLEFLFPRRTFIAIITAACRKPAGLPRKVKISPGLSAFQCENDNKKQASMLISMNSLSLHTLMQYCYENCILILGFAGQALFTCRFFVQWIASERQRKSVVPLSFWYFSIGGGGLLLIYAIIKKDPVFILGQAGGLVIYLRNLYLIRKASSGRKA